jgi:3D (Asp-Asp-Asp) domain-containing protein
MNRVAFYYWLWFAFSVGLTFTLPFMLRADYDKRRIQKTFSSSGAGIDGNGGVSRSPAAIGKTGKSVDFTVTAYCACRECCGDWSRIPVESGRRRTASGRILRRSDTHKIVAASDAYEFGTRIQFEDLGIVTVEDRGRLVTGNRLDLYFGSDPESHRLAREWGIKTKQGRILK